MKALHYVSAAIVLFVASISPAGTIDFTSGIPVFPDPPAFSKSDEGVTFSFEPVNNLVGSPRWISSASGLRIGGGGGSSLEFTFTTDSAVTLDSYLLADFGILGNADFDVRDGATVLSAANNANAAGSSAFTGAPVSLTPGTTYSFVVNTSGAAIQANMSAWTFSVVPEPASNILALAGISLMCLLARRRRS